MAAAVTNEPSDHLREKAGLTDFRDHCSLHYRQRQVFDAMFTLETPCILGGGSGYGGKSYGLRSCAVGYHCWMFEEGFDQSLGKGEGLSTIFASSSYEALRDRHFDYFIREYGEFGDIMLSHKRFGRCFLFHDKRLGAICFRNLDKKAERKGSEFAAGFLDEVTEIPRSVFGEFAYRAGRAYPEIPHRPIVAMTNPDGLGHVWVKAVWRPHLIPVGREAPLSLLQLIRHPSRSMPFDQLGDPSGEMAPEDYIYIPFLPDDNPKFNERAFYRMVAHLAPHVQRARRYGMWDAPEGARFTYLNPETHHFDQEQMFPSGIPLEWKKIIGIDYGLRNPYACLWSAIDFDGNVYTYREDYQSGLTGDAQAARIMQNTRKDEVIDAIYLDPSMWAHLPGHQGPTEISPSDMYDEVLGKDGRFQCGLTRGYNKSRVHALNTLDRYLTRDNDHPDWYIDWRCTSLWSELTGAVFAQGTEIQELSEDLDKRCPDHAITASYYALHTHLYGPDRKPIDPAQVILDEEARRQMLENRYNQDAVEQFHRDARRGKL